jgi:SAM-dependent methyltransferase
MAHADQFEFIGIVKQHFPAFFENVNVLEIGSLDINGSVRSFFAAATYTGVDVAAGPGVDEVCQGQLVGHPSGMFDVVISCECMEHNPFWIETVSNMLRMAKPGGLVIVSCATTGRAEHGTTRSSGSDSPLSISIGWEYYRNIPISVFKRSFNLEYWCEDHVLLSNWHNCDLYFVGVKKPSVNAKAVVPLHDALATRFNVTQSVRSLCISIMAKLFGEPGVSFLRAIWRLIPRIG